MRKINYTCPRRIHFIVNEDGIYLTLIAFNRRLHMTFGRLNLSDGGLWR